MYEKDYFKSSEKDINNLVDSSKKNYIFQSKNFKHIEKKVYQYSVTGEFIKEWKTAKEASIILNCNYGGIRKCCRNLLKTSSHYIWRYYYAEKINPLK